MSNTAVHDIFLHGGRYDGLVVPVPPKAWERAMVFLIHPLQPVNLAARTTDDRWEGYFYYLEDFSPGGELYGVDEVEDESVYHVCRDGAWRPLKLKRAIGG